MKKAAILVMSFVSLIVVSLIILPSCSLFQTLEITDRSTNFVLYSVSSNRTTNWVYISNTQVINSNYLESYGYSNFNISNLMDMSVETWISNALTNSIQIYMTTNSITNTFTVQAAASNYFSYNEVVYVWTFAGSGTATFADGTGTGASFYNPYSLDIDDSDNIYLADDYNHRIRKITSARVVTTLAGSGTGTFADGTNAGASFYHPEGIAVDSSGNIFVGDLFNNRIRKVTPSGIVTTIAGMTEGYQDGTNTNARFNNPLGVDVDDSGNVYVGDFYNDKVRVVDANGVVTTLAGVGYGYVDGNVTNAKFWHVADVEVDSNGNVFLSDFYNSRIRKITPSGDVSTIGSSGSFFWPVGVVVDGAGNVFVADMCNHKIKMIAPSGVVTTIASTGSASYSDGIGANAAFNQPSGLALDSKGNLFIADQFNQRIRKITGIK